jgi:general secretion pathway protein G
LSRGLTLVELVIVITIIGVLTAAISIGVLQAQKRANLGAAKTACSTIRQATMQWKAVNPSSDCATVEQLKAEKDLDTAFNLKDPWGNPYKVSCDADEITCTSAGPDRKEGTEDDIHVPAPDTTENK